MNLTDFEKELQEISKDLSIRPNSPPPRVLEMYPDTGKLASITYMGSELCAIPNFEIYDEPNGSYGVDLRQDGRFIRHRTRPEALSIVKEKLELLKNNKDYADSFFGRGEYSDAALRSKDEVVPQLAEEVTIEPKEVQGGMIEGAK